MRRLLLQHLRWKKGGKEKMNKVLVIANIFPPMGGSGVQRSTKFVKYFREYGIEPVVFTRECRYPKDMSLLEDIPTDVQVVRTKSYDFTEWKKPFHLFGKVIARKLLIPDGDYIWYRRSIAAAVKCIEDNGIECIYTTSYPYSDHLLGRELKRRFPNIPWIVDFRDEWSMNPYIIDKQYSRYRQQKEKKMEESIARECDYFIANTRIMHENFLKMYPFLKNKSSVITNGFDPDDFSHVQRDAQREEKFRLVHPGVIYGNRKIDKVLRSLQQLIAEGSVALEDVELQFIGDINGGKILEETKPYGLRAVTTCLGYLSHRETIQAMNKAEVLLLLLREGEGGQNIAPGKIYEYIYSNRPILALAPKDGVAAEIVYKTRTGIVCDTTDVQEIKVGIQQLYTDWKKKEFNLLPNYDIINNYDRRVLTEQLSEIIRTTLESF